jgi:hypothetical protein
MSGTRSTLEAVLEAEVRRVAWTCQATLKQRASQGAEPFSGKDVESCRRQPGRVEVHGQISAFLEQVAGWRQLAQHQSARLDEAFLDSA